MLKNITVKFSFTRTLFGKNIASKIKLLTICIRQHLFLTQLYVVRYRNLSFTIWPMRKQTPKKVIFLRLQNKLWINYNANQCFLTLSTIFLELNLAAFSKLECFIVVLNFTKYIKSLSIQLA